MRLCGGNLVRGRGIWRAVRLAFAFGGITISAQQGVAAETISVGRWQPFVDEAAARFVIPAEWITRVIRAESVGLTELNGRPIRSPVGAMGLMQLMPNTWQEMRRDYQLGTNPDDPRDNILAGTVYLRRMYDRFGYPGMFAAYNAGPARYAAYLARRSALPRETIAYLSTVIGNGKGGAITSDTPPRELLFALRHDLPLVAQSSSGEAGSRQLFAVRNVDR